MNQIPTTTKPYTGGNVNQLFNIPAAWQNILERIASADGEITPELEHDINSLIDRNKETVTDAVMSKRALELKAELAQAQANVFIEEVNRCKAMADMWTGAAQKLGTLLIPALEILGCTQTPVGSVYLRKTESWAFSLRPNHHFHELDSSLFRNRMELNRAALKELAVRNEIPPEIHAVKTESTSVCLRSPISRKTAGQPVTIGGQMEAA